MSDVIDLDPAPNRVVAGDNGLNVDGVSVDAPKVTFQLWDGEPEVQRNFRDPVDVVMQSSSGKVYLVNIFGDGDEEDAIDLGREDSSWNVRVSFGITSSEDEAYLIQFWPTS
ncbi:hypothetical protein GCM10010468_52520 [Actinocorallia longicatena]|uniref:Uncharacterized protein n=2 Tax=Actinocorallia longicatena TaxID=111803 RepID=A0ABP6QEU9_9ACTN